MGTPTIQPRQRHEALARANRVRHARAAIKRRIANGHMSAADVILSFRWEVETMPVGDLLRSQRQWGETRCRRFLMPMRVPERKTIGSMTTRQRVALASELRRAQATPSAGRT